MCEAALHIQKSEMEHECKYDKGDVLIMKKLNTSESDTAFNRIGLFDTKTDECVKIWERHYRHITYDFDRKYAKKMKCMGLFHDKYKELTLLPHVVHCAISDAKDIGTTISAEESRNYFLITENLVPEGGFICYRCLRNVNIIIEKHKALNYEKGASGFSF